jgi:hypothetical protein
LLAVFYTHDVVAQRLQGSLSIERSIPSSRCLTPVRAGLSYFGGIAADEGAPSTAYWDDVFRRLELAGCQADFTLIEKLVFNHLLLSKAAAKRAGRSFSFDPLPLLFTSAEEIGAKLTEEVIKMPMNKVLRPHSISWPSQATG